MGAPQDSSYNTLQRATRPHRPCGGSTPCATREGPAARGHPGSALRRASIRHSRRAWVARLSFLKHRKHARMAQDPKGVTKLIQPNRPKGQPAKDEEPPVKTDAEGGLRTRRTAHSWRPAPKPGLRAVPSGKKHPGLGGHRESSSPLFGVRPDPDRGSDSKPSLPTVSGCGSSHPPHGGPALVRKLKGLRVEATPPTREGGVWGQGAEPRPVVGGDPKTHPSRPLATLLLS